MCGESLHHLLSSHIFDWIRRKYEKKEFLRPEGAPDEPEDSDDEQVCCFLLFYPTFFSTMFFFVKTANNHCFLDFTGRCCIQ